MNYDEASISPAVQYAIRGGDEAGLAGRGGGVSQTVGVSMTALYIFGGVVAFGLLLFILLRLSSIGRAWDEREGD